MEIYTKTNVIQKNKISLSNKSFVEPSILNDPIRNIKQQKKAIHDKRRREINDDGDDNNNNTG